MTPNHTDDDESLLDDDGFHFVSQGFLVMSGFFFPSTWSPLVCLLQIQICVWISVKLIFFFFFSVKS